MKLYNVKTRSKGFTLIELLIVVVILGILAAVVIPQLSGATNDAKTEALKTNLSNIRTALEMYEHEHSKYPGAAGSGAGGSCNTSGTAGGGAADSPQAVAEQLTMYTDINGNACTVSDTTTYKYGPYMKTTVTGVAGIPNNPVTLSNTVAVVTTGNLTISSSSTTGGWKYDDVSGKVIADHSSYDQY